jgi:hypothetical protein
MYYLHYIEILDSVYKNLPPNGVISRINVLYRDLDDNPIKVYIIQWYDLETSEIRQGYFSMTTGEYLGEKV